MRRTFFVSMMFCVFASLTFPAAAQQGGQETTIPQSFWGMAVHSYCDITSCPPNTFGFPAMPFNWARTLGTGITWNQLELCDPTGNWCPIAGSGCAANYTTSTTHGDAAGGAGTLNNFTNANGASVTCLRPNIDSNVCQSGIWCSSGSACVPNAKLPTDPNNCAYPWNSSSLDQLDQFIPAYNNASTGLVPVMLNLSGTPDFASVAGSRCTGVGTSYNGTDSTCASPSYSTNNTSIFCAGEPLEGGTYLPSGGCVQPYDADSVVGNGNGTGADTILKDFVEAMFAHMYQHYSSTSSETIQYIEIGNEPNNCPEWFHKDGIAYGSSAGPCPDIQSQSKWPPLATANDLVRMAEDVRTIANSPSFNKTGVIPKIVSAPPVGLGSFRGYLSVILNDAYALVGSTNPFDLIGFHGYYTPANDPNGTKYGFCTNEPALTGGTPLTNCPVPETLTQEWQEVYNVLTNSGGSLYVCGTYTSCDPYYNNNTKTGLLPAIDSEFSWGQNTNVVNGDQRAALAARSYILQAQFYPELSQVNWYGEDFTAIPFCWNNNPAGCGTGPGGGTGQFWNSTSVAAGPDNDNCTTAAAAQKGDICQGGIAMEVVNKWLGKAGSVAREFVSAAPQTCTCTGSNCSATPPTGVWACSLALSGSQTYFAQLVWDNTQTTFPCSATTYPKSCGSTLYTLPTYTEPNGTKSNFNNGTSQSQTLDGSTPSAIGAHQATIGIGAKPILVENQKVATKVTPVD